jgi:hypothetical protein
MGAWGMGVFEDDTSCDLIVDAMETDATSFIRKAITYKDSEYLEYEECHEIIVAGVVMDSLLNGTQYAHGTEEFDEWLSNQNSEKLAAMKTGLHTCLLRVLSENSELNELWEENKDDYQTWKSNIVSIANNISK